MRSTGLQALLLCALFVSPAPTAAYTQKVILAEDFGATW